MDNNYGYPIKTVELSDPPPTLSSLDITTKKETIPSEGEEVRSEEDKDESEDLVVEVSPNAVVLSTETETDNESNTSSRSGWDADGFSDFSDSPPTTSFPLRRSNRPRCRTTPHQKSSKYGKLLGSFYPPTPYFEPDPEPDKIPKKDPNSRPEDRCDCLIMDCIGCHYPCKSCGSRKCGHVCKVGRKWNFARVVVQGKGITRYNPDCYNYN